VAATLTDLPSGVGSPVGAAERGASPCPDPGGGARPSRFTEEDALGLAAAVCWAADSP
jgi:hypothetical protein